MSLIINRDKPRQRHWLIHFWPLYLFLLLLVFAIQTAWFYWPELLFKSAVWQKDLHRQMAQLIQQTRDSPQSAGILLMLFSLIYGVLHAVGPGHGKIVIITYLATHPTRLKSSLGLTLAASVLQGMVAIVLVSLVLGGLQLSSSHLHQSSYWLQKGSFLLMLCLGIMLCVRAVKQLYQQVKILRPKKITVQSIQPLFTQPVHSHQCHCVHRHLPSDQELEKDSDWRTRLAIVLAMGMRPCSGAILVLLFSKVIGVYLWGIGSALAMALGTSLTISLLALFVHCARNLAIRLSRQRAPAAWRAVALASLALVGGLILIFSGWLFYLSSQPEIIGGIRLFAR